MSTTFLGMHFSQKLPNIIDMLKSGEKMNFLVNLKNDSSPFFLIILIILTT